MLLHCHFGFLAHKNNAPSLQVANENNVPSLQVAQTDGRTSSIPTLESCTADCTKELSGTAPQIQS
jgi:hypothetical protein